MAHKEHTPESALLEEAITVLFCQIDDAYRTLNPNGHRYGSLKKLSDSEVIALAPRHRARVGGRTRNLGRRLDPAGSHAPAPSSSVGGLRRSRVGEVGHFQ